MVRDAEREQMRDFERDLHAVLRRKNHAVQETFDTVSTGLRRGAENLRRDWSAQPGEEQGAADGRVRRGPAEVVQPRRTHKPRPD